MTGPAAVTTYSRKVCLLGDFAVGKTSLVRRFVYNRFDEKYIVTIGVHVSRKTVTVPRSADVVGVTMMLWDLAGGEEFDRIRSSYLRGAAGAVLVCDLTRPETLDDLRTYAADLHSVAPGARIVVAANKSDLVDEGRLSAGDVGAVASDLGASFHIASAKTGTEVETLFRQLGRGLVAE